MYSKIGATIPIAAKVLYNIKITDNVIGINLTKISSILYNFLLILGLSIINAN